MTAHKKKRKFPKTPTLSSVITTTHTRRLPHLHAIGHPTFLTWRLHNSLPQNDAFSTITTGQSFTAIDRQLDTATKGPLHLRNPELATMLISALRHRHETAYNLHSWVIMANHVHILVTPHIPVPTLMRSLKRFTARQANKILGHTGHSFWQDESYDRLVRNEKEFNSIVWYIEMNPVRAGLAATPEAFPWSSAKERMSQPHILGSKETWLNNTDAKL
jgi:REP element-mobilizing transposase RayT